MHSWDALRQRQDSTLIATLIAPPLLVSIDWAYAFAALQKPPIIDTIRMTGLPWGEGRTQCAHECLSRGHQYLCFIDSDVLVPPNFLMRLLSLRLPVVSALYHQKFPTWTGSEVKYMPCMFNEGRDDKGNAARVEIPFQYGQLVEAHFVPAGALLIHRSVFEKFQQAGIKQFFRWTMNADTPQGRSEDFEFSRTCWQLGIKCYCDTSLQAVHESLAKVDTRGLSAKL